MTKNPEKIEEENEQEKNKEIKSELKENNQNEFFNYQLELRNKMDELKKYEYLQRKYLSLIQNVELELNKYVFEIMGIKSSGTTEEGIKFILNKEISNFSTGEINLYI